MESALHSLLRRQSTGQNRTDEQTNSNASLSSVISTLVPVLLIAGVMFVAFLILRRVYRRQYEPRTFMASLRKQERTPPLPRGLLDWIPALCRIPDTYVLNHQSLDGYLLLRFLKISAVICLVGCCITWPVLFPINATGGNGATELHLLSLNNIQKGSNRLYAHILVAWVFFSFVWYMIARESILYINLRQAYLLSPLYASRLSSRTVLFTSVPADFLEGTALRRLFGARMKNHWAATDCKDLQDLVDQREKVALRLEGAEIKLIKLADAARRKSLKKGASSHEEEGASAPINADGESGSVASRWVQPKQRPTHRLGKVPLVGRKVDTINWSRAELARLTPEIEAVQARHRAGEARTANSVFVEFHTQSDAQAAYQTTIHHMPLHMAPRFIGINPEEVVWENLRIRWWERVLRNYATIGFVVVLVVFWSVPVAFVGVLSNIKNLIGIPWLSWLDFLNRMPPVIFGVIQGLLPSVLLAVLMALLPIVLRLMSRWGGMPSLARIELRTQNFYFAFQVVQVFLVTTLASTAAGAGQAIAQNPTSAPVILAQNIPTVQSLYISYFIVQGLTVASGALLQLAGLVIFMLLGKLLDTTPRKMYRRFTSLSGLGWGTVFPVYTLLSVIAIIYACVSPLMLGFAGVGIYLIYFAYRYNLLFVFDAQVDTKGLVYPRALQQMTVGLYLAEVLMVGECAIFQTIGPTILMVAFLIGSALFHVSLNDALGPLLNTLPKSLEVEEQRLLALEGGAAAADSKAVPDSEAAAAPPHGRPNFLAKWLHPEIHTDYQTLRRLVPRDFADIVYPEDVARDAYYNPAITAETPELWIPRDAMGISAQEIAHTAKAARMSDEGAFMDDKGKVRWDRDVLPPFYREKVYY